MRISWPAVLLFASGCGISKVTICSSKLVYLEYELRNFSKTSTHNHDMRLKLWD